VASPPIGVHNHLTLSHLPSRRILLLLWLSYALFIVYVTTLPFDFSLSLDHAAEKLSQVPHHPFMAPGGRRASYSDMVQNVLMFLPFGGLAVLALRARVGTRRVQGDRPYGRLATVALAGAMGCALSTLVESLQLFTAQRVTSLNDVVTNTAGALGGGAVTVAAMLVIEHARAAPHVMAAAQRSYPVLLWGAVAAFAAWHPFDTTIDVSGIAAKVRGLLADPLQAGILADEGADLLRYTLLGASAVIVLRRWSVPRPALLGATAAALFGCCLEASQLFIGSRAPGGKDATIAVVGAIAGALLARQPRRWTLRSAAATLVAAGWLATALMLLSPYVVSSEPRQMESVPFAAYLPRPDRMVSHAVELTLAFVPVGFALALLMRTRWRWARIAGVAILSGGTLEYLQGWIVGRYPDVTDIGVLTLGALAGAWAAAPLLTDRRLRGAD
jgi:VanZ family protein